MKFGASTWLWTSPFTSDKVELLQKIAELGFDFVEIPVENPGDIDAKALVPVLRDLNLEAVVCTAVVGERDLSTDDPQIRQTAFDYFEACIVLAEALGSNCLAGPLYAPVGKSRLPTEALRQAEWERSANNLRRLASKAGEHGIRLGLEPLNRFETDMICTVADAKRMLADVNSPHLGIALDSFHMNIEEVDFCAAIKQAGEQLVHVQVSDSHRGVPGDGNSDWAGLREGLRAIDYKGKLSIESFSPDASSLADAVCIYQRFAPTQDEFAQRGLDFLRRWWAQA